MLLFYDVCRAYPLLKDSEPLLCLRDFLQSLKGETLDVVTQMQLGERKEQELGFGMRAIFEVYRTKPMNEAFCESHCRYVDFQLVIAGREYFWVGEADFCEIQTQYNKERDLIIYHTPNMQANPQFITLCPHALAVFFPNDVHAGGLHRQSETSEVVHKCVVKVPVELLRLGL